VEQPKLGQRDAEQIRSQKLEHPRDFPVWFVKVARRIYGKRPRNPMSSAQIDRLRLPRFRTGRGQVPLPPSLRAILAFDRDFIAWGDRPLCAPLLASLEADRIEGVTMERVLRSAFPGMFQGLPPHVPIWGAHPEMPALVELHGPGSQRQLLYIGLPDDDGEFPMASFDSEPSLWITRASTVHYVVEAMHHHGVPVAGSINFRALTADARNRNARWEPKEWWDSNDQLQSFMHRYD